MEPAPDLNLVLNQLAAARSEIKNLRQQITSLKHCHRKDIDEINNLLRSWRCSHCRDKGVQSISAGPSDANENNANKYSSDTVCRFIGYIETGFSNKRGVPRQPGILAQSQGIIRLDNLILNNPQHALEGLDQFSHMWILFHFHANESTHVRTKVAPPRLNGIRTGVYATRSPHRPSPIGLSLVKIENVEDDCISFSGVDMIDGTPVLDIKPYIPQYDTPYPAQMNNFTHPNPLSNNSSLSNRSLHWERLPRESDGRSEDGDSILQDQSDNDFDFQDRLLVGEASQSSGSNHNDRDSSLTSQSDLPPIRVLDGRDSDDVFLNDSQLAHINISTDENYLDRSPMRSASQREAPEGSEGSSPPSPAQIADNVRVAEWISNPPVSRLTVEFTEACSRRVDEIIDDTEAAGRIRSSIIAILSEDPRSVFFRIRYSDEHFVCVIAGLKVTCYFDDNEHSCLVTNVEAATNSSSMFDENNQ